MQVAPAYIFINWETFKMKISREELQEIIKEELTKLISEEKLDEGFLDKLLGKDSVKFGDFVTGDEIKKKLDVVQQALGQLRGLAAKQDNKQLALGITNISDNVAQLYGMTTPAGEKLQTIDSEFLKNLKDRLESGSKKDSRARLMSVLAKISPETKNVPENTEQLRALVLSKLRGMPDPEMYGKKKFSPAVGRASSVASSAKLEEGEAEDE